MNMFPIKTLCVLKKYRQSSTFVLLCLFFPGEGVTFGRFA